MNTDTPKSAAAKTEATKTVATATKPVAKAASTKKVVARTVTAKPIVAKVAATKLPPSAKPAASKAAANSSTKVAVKKATEVKKAKKETKVKVVRDSFTMPQAEYQQIIDIKATCLKSGMHVKKSEVLRASLKVLSALTANELKIVLDSLDKIPTGRPKKH